MNGLRDQQSRATELLDCRAARHAELARNHLQADRGSRRGHEVIEARGLSRPLEYGHQRRRQTKNRGTLRGIRNECKRAWTDRNVRLGGSREGRRDIMGEVCDDHAWRDDVPETPPAARRARRGRAARGTAAGAQPETIVFQEIVEAVRELQQMLVPDRAEKLGKVLEHFVGLAAAEVIASQKQGPEGVSAGGAQCTYRGKGSPGAGERLVPEGFAEDRQLASSACQFGQCPSLVGREIEGCELTTWGASQPASKTRVAIERKHGPLEVGQAHPCRPDRARATSASKSASGGKLASRSMITYSGWHTPSAMAYRSQISGWIV